ncbi:MULTISPECIES: efflux RND transporter periplasmic adaptor subunit [Aliiglaciecola]|uniref:efflux RND transporter periplasmic adaptor subunit n=1 Tax=Aliiglaciecola TaxID=1406885 RepID=UPI001C08A8F3|nr:MULTISPECIES: efflux RND transporter periplasmic adaptor subunit [Aliiglaciecola]MBU2878308.1 efflux RND transporter periplasmic adaptor subunit [Aliiglaciecola lipolytica]MDO6711780.1 efflux RND transporter periplasmic adaptor subunit [Aliiglaciecola sp. 2_MG-2023]MDO6753046.1 efflux RND transporter periplasmic adaptor subunit [Aliiglaciecola sp. 1_MG-2023]
MDAHNYNNHASISRSTIKQLSLAAFICSSFLLTACGQAEANKNDQQEAEQVKVIPIPVEVKNLERGNISSNYATTAVLEAKEEAFVVARASGIIDQILVEEGDYVEKGQVLAKLDPERYELNLLRAAADLQGIEKELAKVNKVYHKKLISDDTYDKLTAQYESAKATLALAKLDLKEATIVAPISGYIAERNAKVGNLTESFQRERMFHIVQQKQLYGIVYLPEKELSRVHKDQPASLLLSALSNTTINAYVERISPVIDSKTGTFKVTLRVPNENNLLKAGMFSQVSLNYDTHLDATLLPRKALLAIDDKTNVFVVDEDGIANKIAITVGYQEGNFVEVIKGLTGTEKVVVTGHQNLKDKAVVEIVNS